MERRSVDAEPWCEEFTARAHLNLRTPHGFVGQSARRKWSSPWIPRSGTALSRICEATRFYAHRTVAHYGAPVLRLLGLSDNRVLCADFPVRYSARFHVLGGLPAPARHRSDPGLGSIPFPVGRTRPCLL